jgi:hypothetical protein
MKARRLKALGFALLVSLALLFAGCQQQAQAPQPGQPTTVAVEGVYDSNTTTPVDPNNVSGLVIVRAKVALGSVVPDKVQFLLDDRVEYEVSFGAATQGLRPQQATYTFEWNLNTAGLDGTTPKYPNGAHSVKVRLMKGTTAVATSTATNLVFNNQDFIVLKLSGNAINRGGNRYYGGGPVSVEVVPVLYSGKQVASVRLDMPTVDLDDAAPGVQSTRTLTVAPYVFTIPYNTANRNNANLDGTAFFTAFTPYADFTVTYTDTTTLPSSLRYAVLDGTQVLLDTTGLFSNNPAFASFDKIRLDYYVAPLTGSAIACRGNTVFLVDGQFANDANLRAGLSSLTLDAGVGGDTLVLDVRTTTGATVLADVSVPLTGAGCAGAGALSGLGEGGFYRVFAKAVKDALGNSQTFSPPPSSVAFGIDTTKPTLALGTGRDSRAYFNSASLNTGALSGQDLNGNAVGPTIAGWLNVNDPSSGTPPVASGVDPNGYIWTVNGQTITAVTTSDIPGLNAISAALGSAPQNYYTLTLQATDNAGNASDPVTLLVLYDNADPNVVFTQPSSPALTGGAAFTATARATDNVDLLQGRIFWSYSSGPDNIRFEAYSSSSKAFGPPAQSTVNYSASLTALKPVAGGDFSLFALVRDQAGNAPATSTLTLNVTPANLSTAGAISGVAETIDISGAGGGSTTLIINHLSGTATVRAVHVYLWERNDGTYDYYKFVGNAVSLGGGQYAITVTAPAGLPTPEVLVVVEYDNGLARGRIYNYDSNTLSPTHVF